MVFFKDIRKQTWATVIVAGVGGLVHVFPANLTNLISGPFPFLESFVIPIIGVLTWQKFVGILTLIYVYGLWWRILRRG